VATAAMRKAVDAVVQQLPAKLRVKLEREIEQKVRRAATARALARRAVRDAVLGFASACRLTLRFWPVVPCQLGLGPGDA
jgi:hypothetical protein